MIWSLKQSMEDETGCISDSVSLTGFLTDFGLVSLNSSDFELLEDPVLAH